MGWSNAGWRSDQSGWFKNASSVASSFTFVSGSNVANGNSTTQRDFTAINLGASGGLCVVAVMSQNSDPSSVIVDPGGMNVTLTKDAEMPVATSATSIAIYSGVVSSGGTITIRVNGAAAFSEVGICAWMGVGLSSNLKKQAVVSSFAGSASLSITTASGDYLVALAGGSAGNSSFAGGTETATVHNVDSTGPTATSADYGLPSAGVVTNGSFTVATATNSFGVVAVTYK